MASSELYEISIQLSVLEHLGENLYSGTPAVITEVVANAWDADATEVRIKIDNDEGTISVLDNGHGMNQAAINNRFLSVGFRRRLDQPSVSERFKRPVMGRKGIGKLSLFSIADEFTVHSKTETGEVEAFKVNRLDLVNAIKSKEKTYYPEAIEKEWKKDGWLSGTRINITKLKQDRTIREDFLRQRLARRFSIIGEANSFRVYLNDKEITVSNRGYLRHVQFGWSYDQVSHIHLEESATNIVQLTNATVEGLDGWIGTVKEPKQLKIEGSNDTANGVVVMIRGRLADENIIDTLGDARLFTQYVVGEIHADFLDDDNSQDNIITSARQKLNSDVPAVRELLEKIRVQLNLIALQWDELRKEKGVDDLIEKFPVVEKWLTSLSNGRTVSAKKWISRLNKIPVKDDKELNELVSGSILAFEKLAAYDAEHELDTVSDGDLTGYLSAFRRIDDVEAALYHDIVKNRLKVISSFTSKVDNIALEKELQKELFDNLWLFDPAWDRITGHKSMEITATKYLMQKSSAGDKKDRIDIVYRNPTGEHLIIELKRPNVSADTFDLMKQVSKYETQISEILKNNYQITDPSIRSFLIVGKIPNSWNNEAQRIKDEQMLAIQNIKLFTYRQLLDNSTQIHREFLERNEKTARISQILEEVSKNLER